MYVVKILSSDEFDGLPYKRAKTALGLADAEKGVAYIRDTGYNDITKATISHELDEMIAKTSPHEEDGIRYKDLGQNVSDMFSSAGRGISKVASPIKSAGQGAFNFLNNSADRIGSFFSGGSTSRPKVSANTPGGVFGKALESQRTYQPLAGSNVGDFSESIESRLPSVPQSPDFSSMFSQVPRSQESFVEGEPRFGLKNLMDLFGGKDAIKQVAGPAILGLAGQAFAPSVSIPSFDSIRSRLEQGMSEGAIDPDLRSTAISALKGDITKDPSVVPESAFVRSDQVADDLLDRDLENLRNQFKAANPNADVTNNTRFTELQNEIRERDRERRIGLRQEAEFGFLREELGRRAESIRTALNLDQAQMNQLIQLASLDLNEIMLRAGVSAQEASELKQLFAGFGELLYNSQQSSSQGGANA